MFLLRADDFRRNAPASMDATHCTFDDTFTMISETDFEYCPENVSFTDEELKIVVNCLKKGKHVIVADSLRKKKLIDSDMKAQKEAWDLFTSDVNHIKGGNRRVFEVQSALFLLKSQG